MSESKFQAKLIKTIKRRWPGCLVFKNDPNYMQGVPDLIVLIGSNWIMLECKKSADSPVRPNQEYYIQKADSMSLGRFIYPENEAEVLDEIQRSLGH